MANDMRYVACRICAPALAAPLKAEVKWEYFREKKSAGLKR